MENYIFSLLFYSIFSLFFFFFPNLFAPLLLKWKLHSINVQIHKMILSRHSTKALSLSYCTHCPNGALDWHLMPSKPHPQRIHPQLSARLRKTSRTWFTPQATRLLFTMTETKSNNLHKTTQNYTQLNKKQPQQVRNL